MARLDEVVYSIPVSLCSQLYIISASMSLFGIIVAERTVTPTSTRFITFVHTHLTVILVTRVWALWERRKDIGTLLAFVSIADASAAILTYALYAPSYSCKILLRSLSESSEQSPLNQLHPWTLYLPLLLAVFLSVVMRQPTGLTLLSSYNRREVIFTLTAVKGVQHYMTGGFGTSLIKTLYQDGMQLFSQPKVVWDAYLQTGLIYYVILIIPSIVTLSVTFPTTNASSTGFLLTLQRVLHSVLSARMLLHLRYEVDHLQRNTLGSISFQFKGAESSSSLPSRHHSGQIQQGRHGGWFGPTR
ncbi:hypothetical protein BDZ94DRAFT_1307176 [Collybia nuda]|uniref:Uncharacterized protein n=1 Tax=Collybia nuda TaxID=64659 RepID=A0A9P5YAJ2_9AGAR|nr:hypothetical protein BDZ94DRAFT_1307176 [Collybia nuda]